jgi:nucleoside-diphosphate-sugar epimerase
VEIFDEAVRHHKYTCYLRSDSRLDMMYMPDAIMGMIQLMEADPERLVHRNAFNITGMDFTPEELADEIRHHIADFEITYDVDPVRQVIADSWPNSLDDSAARAEWDWAPRYDLGAMTIAMLAGFRERSGNGPVENAP